MAPRCMTSPYCLMELEYARILGKSVVPLAQIVIHDTPAQELSEADKLVLRNFYQTFGISDVEILTDLDVLKRSHELIGTTDWIYAKENYQPADIQAISAWQSSYENNWFNHNNIDYLRTYSFPSFGTSADSIENVAAAVLRLINTHKDYKKQHTILLEAALHWQEHQKQTDYLLVGNARIAAEAWLVKEFVAPEQAPCLPSNVVAEFICESKKNAENLMTDVFMSFSNKDKVLQQKIYISLCKKLVTTWHYHKDISKAEDAEQATWRGLENADNFVCMLSNHSLQSEFCLREIAYAFELKKRIIPLLIEKLSPQSIEKLKELPKLHSLQTIDFTDNRNLEHYQSDINELLGEINIDKRYHEQHKIFLVQALKWEKQQRNASVLLRGYKLENAKTWLAAAKNKIEYPPLKIHEDFIGESLAKIGQLDSEIFICYSRNDADFARKLNNELQLYGKTTWFDQESIANAADFQQEIYKGIAESDNFVFLISPKSIASPYCEDEVNYANSQGKRFITLLVENLDSETTAKFKTMSKLSEVQWIDCTKSDFYTVFLQLIRVIDTDRKYVEQHSKWQKKATEAMVSTIGLENAETKSLKFKDDLLLAGNQLVLAHEWLEQADESKKSPKPTELQIAFIAASQEVHNKQIEQEKQTAKQLESRLRIAIFTAVVSLVFAITSGIFFYKAEKEKIRADESERAAQKLNQAVYFYADSLALCYGVVGKDKVFYFGDKQGNTIDRLATWDKAMQFEEDIDMAYVKEGIANEFLLDISGQTYTLSFQADTTNEALDLRSLNLAAIPPLVFENKHLQILLLGKNSLDSLDPKIGQLTTLRNLNLRNNQLKNLPKEIAKLSKLEQINLTGNPLKTFPNVLTELTTLTTINLSSNELDSISVSISKLVNLTTINLRKNKLSFLPKEMSNLLKLKNINLNKNDLGYFPNVLTKLPNLKTLDLSTNGLKEVDKEISVLKKLIHLNLNDNELSSLPASLEKLSNLTNLNLNENYFKTLPVAIGKLNNLQRLSLRENDSLDWEQVYEVLSTNTQKKVFTLKENLSTIKGILLVEIDENQLAEVKKYATDEELWLIDTEKKKEKTWWQRLFN
jgi:Leucine-rich repeat (LRR) protein